MSTVVVPRKAWISGTNARAAQNDTRCWSPKHCGNAGLVRFAVGERCLLVSALVAEWLGVATFGAAPGNRPAHIALFLDPNSTGADVPVHTDVLGGLRVSNAVIQSNHANDRVTQKACDAEGRHGNEWLERLCPR